MVTIPIQKDKRVKKNIQQKQIPDKTSKIQDADLLQKPRRLLFLGPLLIGFIGFLFLFWATSNYGVGLSGDSVDYIKWARNLVENHSFSKQDGSLLIMWPPLYPISIACFKLCGVNDFLAVRLISTISFGLIIFLSGLLILKYSGSLFFAIICSLCALLSKPLMAACSWAWSEPLFILLMMIFLLLVPDIINRPTFKSTLLLAIVTSAFCLTRYIGVVLLPVGAIVLFYGIKHFRKKWIFTIFWGIVSLILPGIWILRNHILTGTFTGVRPAAKVTFFENIQLTGNVIGSWLIPLDFKNPVSGWLFFILVCIFILALFVFIAHKIIKSKEFDWLLIIVFLFIFIYMATIIYAVTKTSMDFLDDRLLSPVYPAIVICLGVVLTKLLGPNLKFSQTEKHSAQRIIRYGFLVGIGTGILLDSGLIWAAQIQWRLSNEGVGFANVQYKNSQTIAWLKVNLLKGRIYTNDPPCMYILAGIDSYMVPTKLDYFKNLNPSDQNALVQQILKFKSSLESEENVYLVWIFYNERKYLYTPVQLQEFCTTKVIKKFDDGYVIALYPKKPSDSPVQ